MSNFTLQLFPAGNYTGTYSFIPISGGSLISRSITSSSEVIDLVPGKYTLDVNVNGFASTSQVIDSSSGSIVIPLTANTDDSSVGLPNNGGTTIVVPPPVSTFNAASTPEFLPPTTDYGKYFMSTDARLYIGNVFLDEVDSVQFVLQSNQVPVYPYRSSQFAAVGQGRSLVQGQISINFISEGYLYSVLDNYNKTLKIGSNSSQDELNSLQIAKQNIGNTFPSIAGASTTTTAANQAANQSDLNAINSRITAILASQGSNGASALSESIAFASKAANADTVYCNAVYQAGPFDIVANFSGGNRTVKRKLENCFLISNEQVIARDGKIIMDQYGFICRRIR